MRCIDNASFIAEMLCWAFDFAHECSTNEDEEAARRKHNLVT